MASPYRSPTEADLELRRQRGRAAEADTTLTPARVRRAFTTPIPVGVGTSAGNRDTSDVLREARTVLDDVDLYDEDLDEYIRRVDESMASPQSPAVGVGATDSNRVTGIDPATFQQVVDEGDRDVLQDVMDQMNPDDLERYLDQLPSPPSTRQSTPIRRRNTTQSRGRATRSRGRVRQRGTTRSRGRGRTTTTSTTGNRIGEGTRERPYRLRQDDMQRQLELLLNDTRQTATGRRIAGITTTNTITTTYKDGGRPVVTRNSTSVRN